MERISEYRSIVNKFYKSFSHDKWFRFNHQTTGYKNGKLWTLREIWEICRKTHGICYHKSIWHILKFLYKIFTRPAVTTSAQILTLELFWITKKHFIIQYLDIACVICNLLITLCIFLVCMYWIQKYLFKPAPYFYS